MNQKKPDETKKYPKSWTQKKRKPTKARASVDTAKPRSTKPSDPYHVRLNKFIADQGICSRRAADALIEEGKVTVNGRKVFELGVKINSRVDSVAIDRKIINKKSKNFIYFVVNKPTQVLTSMSDPSGRPTIADILPKYKKSHRLFPVGRLDWDSEGLLIITNDGDYSQRVTHPSEEIPKTYHVKIDKELTEVKKQKLLSGITIIGGRVKATEVFRMKKNMRGQKTFWASITITEGKNRQVRRMFEKLDIDVLKLRRVSIGGLKIGALKKGQVLQMDPDKAMKVFEKPKTKTYPAASRARKD